MGHHIWCNYWTRPEKECKHCARLRKKYPEDRSPDEMLKRHFPNVKSINKGVNQ